MVLAIVALVILWLFFLVWQQLKNVKVSELLRVFPVNSPVDESSNLCEWLTAAGFDALTRQQITCEQYKRIDAQTVTRSVLTGHQRVKQLGDMQPRSEGGMEVAVGREGGGVVVVVPSCPASHLYPLQMPHDDRGPRHRPQQDTWHWRELSVLPEAGACQATAAGLRVSTHNNPPKKHPSTPKPLHNPPSTPGHAGQRPPQYDHCCAPGWLSPPYQKDETTSSTHTHTTTAAWCVCVCVCVSVVVC